MTLSNTNNIAKNKIQAKYSLNKAYFKVLNQEYKFISIVEFNESTCCISTDIFTENELFKELPYAEYSSTFINSVFADVSYELLEFMIHSYKEFEAQNFKVNKS